MGPFPVLARAQPQPTLKLAPKCASPAIHPASSARTPPICCVLSARVTRFATPVPSAWINARRSIMGTRQLNPAKCVIKTAWRAKALYPQIA